MELRVGVLPNEFRGTLDLAIGTIKASRVTLRRPEATMTDVSLKGAMADFVGSGHFYVDGTMFTITGKARHASSTARSSTAQDPCHV